MISCLNSSNNPYQVLSDDYREVNFFHGKAKNYYNKTLHADQNPVRIEPYHNCVSYGKRDEPMTVITYQELLGLFSSNNSFRKIDGGEGEEYSEKQIEKLMFLTSKDKIESESALSYRFRRLLGSEISRIRRFINGRTTECRKMLQQLGNEKELISSALLSLFRLSLYMRGWDEEGPLPLKSSDAAINNTSQGDIDIRVSEGIVDFEQKCEYLSEPKKVLLLPLMYYVAGNFTFSSNEECWTIRDRLNIVKGGDDSDSITSCIRLSSNWFLFTSYYYLSHLGVKLGINLNDVDTIG
jgi:hypothetical protein